MQTVGMIGEQIASVLHPPRFNIVVAKLIPTS